MRARVATVSKKQSAINRRLKKVYDTIANERGHYCTGCGRANVILSHSHLISRAKRPDLICDPNNITYHCLSMADNNGESRKGCHDLWEGTLRDKQKLLDFHRNMEYIVEKDYEYYHYITELNNKL